MNIIKTTATLLFVLFIGLLGGCNHHTESVVIDPELAQELWKKHMNALCMNDADSQCVAKINDLAFSMLHQMSKNHPDSSFVVSPLSIACAIAMTGNGAQDGTRDEIEQLVGPIADANAFFKKYSDALPHNDYTDCHLLNYLAINSKNPIKDEFLKNVSSNYNACAKNLDFDDVESVKQVNEWFSLQSQEKLTKAIDELDPASSLHVFDALLYNAIWSSSFDKSETFDDYFISDKGDTLLLPMMNQKYPKIYCDDGDDYQAVALPYSGGCYWFLVVMPKSAKLSEFCATMSREKYTSILDAFQNKYDINLSLPRFQCDNNLDMTGFVKEMMPSAFGPKADFSDISSLPMFISRIGQKTKIEVTEVKTTAVSVTDVDVAIISIEDILESGFNANHPFLYFVYDEATHAILLMGQFCGDGAIFD